MADHQLDDCDLTFHELREVIESFCFTLKSMLHRRIAYPKKPAVSTPATVFLSAAREHENARPREVAATAAAASAQAAS